MPCPCHRSWNLCGSQLLGSLYIWIAIHEPWLMYAHCICWLVWRCSNMFIYCLYAFMFYYFLLPIGSWSKSTLMLGMKWSCQVVFSFGKSTNSLPSGPSLGSESNSQRQRWIDTPNWAVYLSEYQLKIFKHHIIYYHYLEGTPIINKPWFMNPELNSKTYWPTVSMLIDVPRRKVELWRSSSVLPSEADVLPTEKGGWPGGILAPQNSTKQLEKASDEKRFFAFLLFYRFFRIIVQTLNVPSHYERRLLELEISQVQHEVLRQTQS